MDIVQRLVLVMLLLLSSSVQAEDVLMKFSYQGVGPYESREEVCLAYMHPSWGSYRWSNGSCVNNMHSSQFLAIVMSSVCNGQFFNNYRFSAIDDRYATCRYVNPCPEPQVRNPDNGACEAPPPPSCEPGCNGACGSYMPFTAKGSQSCINNCYYTLEGSFAVVTGNGQTVYWNDVGPNTGVSCTEPDDETPGDDGDPPKADLPDPCPECECAKKKMSWGEVNGAIVCVKPGTPGSKPVETANPPTTKTETPAPTPENPNPDPVTTVTPSPVITITPGSGAGSQPTITETVTNPDGSTTSTNEPQESYCQKNPSAKLCKESDKEEGKGSWGGGCGSWECEGDAAQCAMARKIHQDRCDDLQGMEQFESAASKGQKLLHGESDEDVTAYLNREGDGNRTINVGSMVSESGNYQFAASCISDVQFSIGGHAITVPISKVCPYFEMIGYFLLAAAYLAALRIVGVI